MKIIRYRPLHKSFKEDRWVVFKITDTNDAERDTILAMMSSPTVVHALSSKHEGYYDLIWFEPDSDDLAMFIMGFSDEIVGDWKKCPRPEPSWY